MINACLTEIPPQYFLPVSLLKKHHAERAILFGSYARHERNSPVNQEVRRIFLLHKTGSL